MLEAPEIVAPVLTASVLIALVLATLVLFAASTGADSTTAGSNVLQAPVLLVPVIVASVLSAILNLKGIYAVLSRIWKCRKSRVFGANFLGQKIGRCLFYTFLQLWGLVTHVAR